MKLCFEKTAVNPYRIVGNRDLRLSDLMESGRRERGYVVGQRNVAQNRDLKGGLVANEPSRVGEKNPAFLRVNRNGSDEIR